MSHDQKPHARRALTRRLIETAHALPQNGGPIPYSTQGELRSLLREAAARLAEYELDAKPCASPGEISDAARIHALQEAQGCLNGLHNKRHEMSKDLILLRMNEMLDCLMRQEKGSVMVPSVRWQDFGSAAALGMPQREVRMDALGMPQNEPELKAADKRKASENSSRIRAYLKSVRSGVDAANQAMTEMRYGQKALEAEIAGLASSTDALAKILNGDDP